MRTCILIAAIAAFVAWITVLIRQARRIMKPCQRCRRLHFLENLSTVDRRLMCGPCVAVEIQEAFEADRVVIANRRGGKWQYSVKA